MNFHTFLLYLHGNSLLLMITAPAYYQVLEIADQVRNLSSKQTVYTEEYIGDSLERTPLSEKSSRLNLDFAQLSLDWLAELSNPAKLFIVSRIMPNLKMYNLLWYCPVTKKSSEKITLKELIDCKCLFRTEVAGIYIVNPVKIWKGTIPGAVELTKALLRKHKRPSIDLIYDLKPRKSIQTKTAEDGYHDLGGFGPHLLAEPIAPYGKVVD